MLRIYGNRNVERLPRSRNLGYTHILILGHFNLHIFNFTEHTHGGGDYAAEARFFKLIEELRLRENLKLLTRLRNITMPLSLDCLFTREDFLIDHLLLLAPISKVIAPS